MIFLKTESLQQPGRVSIETSRSLQRIVAERSAGLAAVAAAATRCGGAGMIGVRAGRETERRGQRCSRGGRR